MATIVVLNSKDVRNTGSLCSEQKHQRCLSDITSWLKDCDDIHKVHLQPYEV